MRLEAISAEIRPRRPSEAMDLGFWEPDTVVEGLAFVPFGVVALFTAGWISEGMAAMSRGLMQEFFLRLFEENRRTNLYVTSEIDEAIFLADRLVVLSNRPAQLRAVIDIDLPRPRHYQVMSSPEAFEYKREAMEILHEEAMRSFRLFPAVRPPAGP